MRVTLTHTSKYICTFILTTRQTQDINTLIYQNQNLFFLFIIFFYNVTQGSVRIDLQFGPDPDLGPEFEKPCMGRPSAILYGSG